LNDGECVRRTLQSCIYHQGGIVILWLLLYWSGDNILWAQHAVATFGSVMELKVPRSTLGIVGGDFNGDGTPDIAAFGSEGVRLYLREHRSSRYRTVPTGITKPIMMMEGARCNGDRITDLVMVSGQPPALQVYLLKRNGRSSLSWESQLDEPVEHLLLADINDDGKTDILLYGKKRLGVTAYLGIGNGTFRSPITIFPENSFGAVSVSRPHDMENSNVFAADWVSNQVLFFSAFGRMKFSSPSVLQCPFEPSLIVQVQDDESENAFTVVGSVGNPSLLLFKQNARGEFEHVSDLNIGTPVSALNVADINGDGRPDIVAMSSDDKTLNVFLNGGEGHFGEHVNLFCGKSAADFLLAQNNDVGGTDAAVLDSASSLVRIFRSTETPLTSEPENVFGTGPRPGQVAFFDINGDGTQDLILANRGAQSISLFLTTPGGYLAGQIQFPLQSVPSSFQPFALNDSTSVIVSTASEAGNITILELDTRHLAHSTYALPTDGEVQVLSVHADSSGQFLHILATVKEGIPPRSSIIEFVQIGQNRFIERTVSTPKAESIADAVLGDFSGDGVPDLVYSQPDTRRHTYNLFESYGTISGDFLPPALISSYTDSAVSGIHLWHHDLTGDGIQDLVCNIIGAKNSVCVLRGRKDSTLVPFPHPLSGDITVSLPDRLKFVDINTDGKIDIVLENQQTKSVEVHLNLGEGNFAPPYVLTSTEGLGGFDIGRIEHGTGYELALSDSINGLLRIISLK